MVMPKRRNLYYVVDKNEDWFVKGSINEYQKTFTGEIDNAFRTYSKEKAFDVSDECNEDGMDTKVIVISWEATIWNRNVPRK